MAESSEFSPPTHSIWLLGDTGAVQVDGQDPVLLGLQKDLKEHPSGCVVLLGDLIYPKGMPEKDDPGRAAAEAVMLAQLAVLKDYPGKVYFISGNHDWKKGSSTGWKNLRRLETFITEEMGQASVCMPQMPGPGPECVEIFPGFHLVFLNTQWWMQPGVRNPFRVASFFSELKEMLSHLNPKTTLICGHHPVRSHSLHGGKFRKKHHLFPLSLYGIGSPPLPGVGSLLLMYRKYVGAKEDMANPRYSKFREMLLDLLEGFPGISYASGHEHNLQWIKRDEINHLISGAGSKSYYVRKGKGTLFAGQKKGFFRLEVNQLGIQSLHIFEQEELDSEVRLTQSFNWSSLQQANLIKQ
jgi:hypothetical protein